MAKLRGGPLEGYEPPTEQKVPNDWTYLGPDDRLHRYLRTREGVDWKYQGDSERQPSPIDVPLPDPILEPDLPPAAPAGE